MIRERRRCDFCQITLTICFEYTQVFEMLPVSVTAGLRWVQLMLQIRPNLVLIQP